MWHGPSFPGRLSAHGPAVLLVAASALNSTAVHAQDATGHSEVSASKPEATTLPQDPELQPQEKKLKPNRTETAILPAFSVDTDAGVGFGIFTHIARFEEGYDPYAWRLQAQVKMSIKTGPDGVEFPTHDHFLDFDRPSLFDPDLRFYARLAYWKNIIAGWYGLGNASSDDQLGNARRFQYKREEPTLRLKGRYEFFESFSSFATIRYRYVSTDTYAESKLQEDIDASIDGTGEEIFGYNSHSLIEFQFGSIWDTRNHEQAPSAGGFYEFSTRGSPGGLTGADHNYVGFNVQMSHFFDVFGEYLVFGMRGAGDLLQGDVPYYGLGTAIGLRERRVFGSAMGVRGIPTRRYNGKVKLFLNTELRSLFTSFWLFGDLFKVGASAFFDAGRLWYDLSPHPELDGTGIGIKYGIGGGPQLLWGDALVVRMDVAYSPDADPVGFYLDIGRAF